MISTPIQNHDDIIIYTTVTTRSAHCFPGCFQDAHEHKTLFARLKADIMPTSGYLSTGPEMSPKGTTHHCNIMDNPKINYSS